MRLVEKGWMELKEEVIDTDKCCQCGNCTAVCDAIRMTVHGPVADSDLCQERPTCKDGLGTCYNLCPRTRDNPISPLLLNSWVNGVSDMLESNPFHHEIQVFAVRAVPRDRFPVVGGAGSIRALLLAGIKEEIIDGVVHSSTLSGVQEVLDTEAELLNDGRQFQLPYAPNNILLDAVSNGYQDLAVIGSGCEIQALRHAQNHPILDFELHEMVRLAIGCFCFFKPRPDRLNQFLNGNQDKQEITRIIKEPGSFYYKIEGRGTSRRIRARTFIDASKGTCPSCMDHVGNLADISIGQIDAMAGWDMVIIRSQVGRDVLEAAKRHRFVEVREVHDVIEDLTLEITRNRIKFLPIQEIDIVGPKVKHFWFKSPRILSRYSPGQFIVIWLPGVDFLPMTISAIDQDRFRISVKLVGEGTKMLFEMNEGEKVGIRGPYGTSWDLTGDDYLLVGGGIGSSALLPAMNQLIREGKRVTAIFGSKTKNEVFCPESAISCILTEDGTLGEEGTVDEKIIQAVKDHAIKEILACGPEKMLERVLDMANDLGIRYQASVERVMKCCVGICGSCTMGDENVKTTCKDGPIFTGEELKEFPSFGKHE